MKLNSKVIEALLALVASIYLCYLIHDVKYSHVLNSAENSEPVLNLAGYAYKIDIDDDEEEEEPDNTAAQADPSSTPTDPAPDSQPLDQPASGFKMIAGHEPARVIWYSPSDNPDEVKGLYLSTHDYYSDIAATVVRFRDRPVQLKSQLGFDEDPDVFLKFVTEESTTTPTTPSPLAPQPPEAGYPEDIVIGLGLDPDSKEYHSPLNTLNFVSTSFPVWEDFVELDSEGRRIRFLVMEPSAYPHAAEIGVPYIEGQEVVVEELVIEEGADSSDHQASLIESEVESGQTDQTDESDTSQPTIETSDGVEDTPSTEDIETLDMATHAQPAPSE